MDHRDYRQFNNSPTRGMLHPMELMEGVPAEIQWLNSTAIYPALGVGGFVADCVQSADEFHP